MNQTSSKFKTLKKTPIRKQKGKAQTEKHFSQNTYLTKYFYPEYTNNSYNSTRQTIQLKQTKSFNTL